MKSAVFLLFLFIFSSITLNAQKYLGTLDEDYNFDMFDWDFRNPTIEVNYGNSSLFHKKFDGKFSVAGLTEIKLGYSTMDDFEDVSYIKDFSERVISLSNRSTDLSGKSNETGGF